MPEQKSDRGDQVTTSRFTGAMEDVVWPFGEGGLNLADAIDKLAVGEYARLTNAQFTPGDSRELTSRFGQTALATTGTTDPIHSVVQLIDVQTADDTRVWGVGSAIFLGSDGALTQIDAGYSGDPLTLLPFRPPISGQPWVFIGDGTKMAKVRFDGLVLPIGLPAPTLPTSTVLDTEQTTPILGNGVEDSWTANPGFDFSAPALPANAGLTDVSTDGVTITSNPGPDVLNAGNGYWSFWGTAKTLDLNTVGAKGASDDDIMQLRMKFGNPALVAECRLYLVCSEVFSPSVLPGSGTDASGAPTDANTDFYVKAFRPSDFAPFINALQAQIDNAETTRVRNIREQALAQASRDRGFAEVSGHAVTRVDTDFMATEDPARATSVVAGGAANAYANLGTIGLPLRRGDWQRYGTTEGRDWGTITGIILYLQARPNADTPDPTTLLIFATILDWQLTGGSGPDTIDPATQSYDHRFTHYDPRTGAEGNPSPIMDESLWLDSLRRAILVTPTAYGDSAVRQRFYRRGGTLLDNWYFLGENTADGAVFTDDLSDTSIEAAGTVEIDHYQPVATVDDNGDAVLAQPVPVLFGPVNGQLFALGDPYRPGFVYASLPGEPDHWPSDLTCEVCPSSEELMNGLLYGTQLYVFSRERLYALYVNLTGETGMTATPTECRKGLAGRWWYTVGAGAIWFGHATGIFRTGGGPEECITDEWVRPLFLGQSVHGYAPIDFSVEAALRMAVFAQELWVAYQDTNGAQQILIFTILNGRWRHYQFTHALACVYTDLPTPDAVLILGGTAGTAYTYGGTSDDGSPIPVTVRTGAWDFSRPREEKLFGDQALDVIGRDVEITLTNLLNAETVTNPGVALTPPGTDRSHVIYDSFGTVPQRARTLSSQLTWSTAAAPPVVYFLVTAITLQPDLTINRVTNWDDLGAPDESYVTGVTFDCDTGGETRTIVIERDFGGVIDTVATLSVLADGRHKLKFSWPAVQANQVRIRPDDACKAWILYRADWISQPEPPRIAGWDIHFESEWDQYYTGLDLYCDTNGQPKTIVVQVDGVTLTDPATGDPFWTVTTTGRQVVHLTLPWGRGHVFHFTATDANPGLLYKHRWHLAPEPSEQTNWNQPFTIWGTGADKYLKALIFEVDTFGETKTVEVQADEHTLRTTILVAATGRQVVQVAFPQILGRVFRIFPSDAFPSRLYSLQPVFDEEPYQLTRWETQEIDHGQAGFHSLLEAMVTLRSTADVTLTILTHVNQTGTIETDSYVVPSTAGVKLKRFVPFNPRKGVLMKYVLTSAAAFHLYREESGVWVQPFTSATPTFVHVFGNDDLTTPTRGMIDAVSAATASGGGTT